MWESNHGFILTTADDRMTVGFEVLTAVVMKLEFQRTTRRYITEDRTLDRETC
jgi:hypothetical protein